MNSANSNFLTVKEAAENYNLSQKTLKDWLRAGKVKGEKIGRSWRIKEDDIREYLKLSPLISSEQITKQFIQTELEKLQQLLLDVDQEHKEGMKKSEALKLVGELEEIIQDLTGTELNRLDRCQWERDTRSPRFAAKNPKQIPLEDEIQIRINDIINELVLESNDLDILADIEFIENSISNVLQMKLSPRGRNDLNELIKIATKYQEKDAQKQFTMSDAYKFSSYLRRIQEHVEDCIDTYGLSGKVIETTRIGGHI